MLVTALISFEGRPEWVLETNSKTRLSPAYAIGLALPHPRLRRVSSPYANIFLLGPSNSIHLESLLTWSTALLKCHVLLSEEKTSVYIRYATPPYVELVAIRPGFP
jgi:hypothetical protein